MRRRVATTCAAAFLFVRSKVLIALGLLTVLLLFGQVPLARTLVGARRCARRFEVSSQLFEELHFSVIAAIDGTVQK